MLKVGDQVQILPSAVIVGIPEIFIGHTAVINAVYPNNLTVYPNNLTSNLVQIKINDEDNNTWFCFTKHLKKIQPSETANISIWNYI